MGGSPASQCGSRAKKAVEAWRAVPGGPGWSPDRDPPPPPHSPRCAGRWAGRPASFCSLVSNSPSPSGRQVYYTRSFLSFDVHRAATPRRAPPCGRCARIGPRRADSELARASDTSDLFSDVTRGHAAHDSLSG